MKHIITLCLLLSFTSCAFIKREGQWGKNAFKFKAQKIGRAFVDNAKDPNVWAPLIGAAVIGFTKQDKKISDWGSKETPIYGSIATADEESNEHEEMMQKASYATLMLTTSWDGSYGGYAFNKLKGGTAMWLANKGSLSASNNSKDFFKRERPNEKNNKSMPSGHSMRASTYHLLVRRNVAASNLNPYVGKALVITSGAYTAATMWSRVEGKMHYPSDTLVGYSMGQFVGGVIFDSIMNMDMNETLAIYPTTSGNLTAMYTVMF